MSKRVHELGHHLLGPDRGSDPLEERELGPFTNRPAVREKACRLCGAFLEHTFIDLGVSPLANTYLKPSELCTMEPFYPVCVYVCERCFLVQLEEFESPERIFGDYAYFSSYSDTWLRPIS